MSHCVKLVAGDSFLSHYHTAETCKKWRRVPIFFAAAYIVRRLSQEHHRPEIECDSAFAPLRFSLFSEKFAAKVARDVVSAEPIPVLLQLFKLSLTHFESI